MNTKLVKKLIEVLRGRDGYGVWDATVWNCVTGEVYRDWRDAIVSAIVDCVVFGPRIWKVAFKLRKFV